MLGERDEAPGRAWHVPNAPPIAARALLERAFALAGRPVRVSRMTRFGLMVGGLFVPAAREMVEMAYEFERPFVVDHSDWTRTFGTAATPLDAALGRTLDWYARRASITAEAGGRAVAGSG